MTAEAPQPPDHTRGEQTFEAYLRSQGFTGFEHEKPFPGKSKHPDYSLIVDGCELLFEVKDIDSNPLAPDGPSRPGEPRIRVGFWDPHEAIREKIDQARKKFREFKEYPCSLVLFAGGLALLDEWTVMFGAMHGDIGFQQLVNTSTGLPIRGTEAQVFGRGGRMTQPHWRDPQNTTINAVIATRWIRIGEKRFVHRYLSQFGETEAFDHLADEVDFDKEECVPGVIVYENLDAAHPLPRDLFTGPFDLRYAWDEDGHLVTPHVGAGIEELGELEKIAKETGKKIAEEWSRTKD